MDLLKQLRELVAGVDLSDEEREALNVLIADLEAQHEEQRSQIEVFETAQAEALADQDADEDTDESRESEPPEIVVDLGPVADKLGEFAKPIADALRELNEKIDAIVATVAEDEAVDEGSADAETDERSAETDERLDKVESAIKTLREALPVRRGVVGDAEADDSEDDTHSELDARLEGVTDPAERLRETIGEFVD